LPTKEREADILRTIMDGLAAMDVWAIRMNSGMTISYYKGKKRAIRYGRKGCADILAIPRTLLLGPIWIEVKRPGETQSLDQVFFEGEVKAQGHRYILAHSWEDVLEALR
jgi:hypothetical protein